ncbi:membrane protein [Streptomyces noursei ATCC 11455]|nr:membrane protein [Streptomyces noursei ATCC 11455]
MPNLRSYVSVGVAVGALLLAGPTVAATAAPNGASTGAIVGLTCGSGVNPKDFSHPETVTSVNIGHTRIALRNGRRGGKTYLWALIRGASRGNTIRLDWGDVPGPGAQDHRCSNTVHFGSDQHTIAIQYVQVKGGGHRTFRACGDHAGTMKCTPWVP